MYEKHSRHSRALHIWPLAPLAAFSDEAKPTAAPAAAPSPASIALGDVTDSRTTGQFFSGMKVEFKLSGDAVFDSYGIGRPNFTVAKDDTGRSLIKDEKKETLLWDLQQSRGKSTSETTSGELANPARKANTITLQGTIPVYSPALDPTAVVSLPNLAAMYGKPLESKETQIYLNVLDKTAADAYAKAKAETAKQAAGNAVNAALGAAFGFNSSLRDNDVQFRVKDPNAHLVRLEIVGADGKPIENHGRSKMSNDGEDVYTYNFNQPLPKDAGLKIYYATAKSMIMVPFDFQNVALP